MNFFQPGQQSYCQSVGVSTTANNVIFQRDPTANDVTYKIGMFWQNNVLERLFYLNSFTSDNGILQAVWVLVSVESLLVSLSGSDTPNDAVLPTTSSASPLPDNIQLANLDGSMTIMSDPTNHRVVFSANPPGPSFLWVDKSSSSPILEVDTGYFCTTALTGTLPLSPVQGDIVKIAVDSAGVVIVQASTGQTIRIGNTSSTTAGTATSTAIGSSLELIYRFSNSEWFCVSTTGSWVLA